MPLDLIDVRSDTVTRPTAGMRDAMRDAEVGDDHLGDDPTTRALEERIAGLLGKERSLFFPSGTMANQTALAILAKPGTEVIVEAAAHMFHLEGGGAAALNGLQLRPVPSPDGRLTAELVEAHLRPADRYLPTTSAVCIENTHSTAGGRVLSLDQARAVSELCGTEGVPVHLDGARLWNAAVATGHPVRDLAAPADTVMVSISKGLGAPVGSLLAGPSPLMEEAWTVRRRLGGAMRQSGVLAAAGLYALDHHVERLAADHELAVELARRASAIDGLRVVPPETNFVMIDIERPEVRTGALLGFLEKHRILMARYGQRRLRAAIHLDVQDSAPKRIVEALGTAMQELAS